MKNPVNYVGVGGHRLGIVPVNRIEKADFNPKSRTTDKKLKDLKESVEEFGLISPIIVGENGGDKYMLMDGHRRFTAATQLGHETIVCIILDENQAKMFAILNGTTARMREKDNQEIYVINPDALTDRARKNQERALEFLGYELYFRLVKEGKVTVTSLRAEAARLKQFLEEYEPNFAKRYTTTQYAEAVYRVGQRRVRAILDEYQPLAAVKKLKEIYFGK